MGADAQNGELEGESIDQAEENLCADDGVDHASEESLCNNGMLFHEFREVVQSRGYLSMT